ncbi:MAG: hypothetical protein AB7F23_03045 [Phycisphaerae bacterium]
MRGLVEYLAMEDGRKRVLVPDYICNVVHKACSDAGLSVSEYPTDENLMPLWEDLGELLKEDENTILIVTSMMGACPVLSDGMVELENAHPELFVISDECQNLVSQSPVLLRSNRAIVFSFNDKTCPGLMGGGVVCLDNMLLKPQHHSIQNSVKVTLSFLCAMLKRLSKDLCLMIRLLTSRNSLYSVPDGYEFSECTSAHYNTCPEAINKISAAYAMLNLRNLSRFEQIRKNNYASVCEYARQLPPEHTSVPAFLIIGTGEELSACYPAPVKAPYAMNCNRDETSKGLYALKLNNPYVRYKEYE